MSDEMNKGDEFEQCEDQNGAEEMTEDNAEGQEMANDEEDDDDQDERKLFVGGLSWETTTKDLREYFEKFGEVTSCTLKTDLETRKSRGFGFVVFASTDSVDKVLAEKEHKLHGRTIDPKKANPRPVNKKVFVGRLDPALSEDEVRTYFEKFGPVEKLELPFDKSKDQRRAFCFVEFKKLASMKKCLEQASHKIGSQDVEVKKATPPGTGTMRGAPRGRGFGPVSRGGRGGRGGFHGGYGYNQGYGYGNYGNYGGDYSYNYGPYSGDYGYGGGYGNYGGGWNNGGYDQGYGYGYGGYDEWGYGQGGGQSNYGKAQKRGAAHGGYHPYNR